MLFPVCPHCIMKVPPFSVPCPPTLFISLSLCLSFSFCTTIYLSLTLSLFLYLSPFFFSLSVRLSFPEAMCLFLSSVHLLVSVFKLPTAPLFASLHRCFLPPQTISFFVFLAFCLCLTSCLCFVILSFFSSFQLPFV